MNGGRYKLEIIGSGGIYFSSWILVLGSGTLGKVPCMNKQRSIFSIFWP